MVWRQKARGAKSDDLSSIPGTYISEGKNQTSTQAILCPPQHRAVAQILIYAKCIH